MPRRSYRPELASNRAIGAKVCVTELAQCALNEIQLRLSGTWTAPMAQYVTFFHGPALTLKIENRRWIGAEATRSSQPGGMWA